MQTNEKIYFTSRIPGDNIFKHEEHDDYGHLQEVILPKDLHGMKFEWQDNVGNLND